MAEDPELEEYWGDLRRRPPKPEKKSPRKKTREELDEAIVARSDHLRAYWNNKFLTPSEEESERIREQEELRQAVLDRAPYMDEWVIQRRPRSEDEVFEEE